MSTDRVTQQIEWSEQVADSMLNPALTPYTAQQILLEALYHSGFKLARDEDGLAVAALNKTLIPDDFDPLEGT